MLYVSYYVIVYCLTFREPLAGLYKPVITQPLKNDVLLSNYVLRPVRLLRVWISEGLTQADS